MNDTQTEYRNLRNAGLLAPEAITEMIAWRITVIATLCQSMHWPKHVSALVTEMSGEIKRLRVARHLAGLRS